MIKKIKAYAKRNKGEADFNLHMCFYGSPGTGKTEVARILSRILYDAGVLGEAKLVETDGQGLLGKAVGETAPKTEAKINEAINGVLFIDEAYTLTGGTISGASNYGDEAIAVLLKEMEDRRGQFCVILAGYKDEMNELLSANPGFRSRIQFNLEFPDYSREELSEIANVFLTKKKYMIEDTAFENTEEASAVEIPPADISEVKIDYKTSEIYSKEDMDGAIEKILDEFGSWDGCVLYTISYTDDTTCTDNLSYVRELDSEKDYKQCIVFTSNFHSPVVEYGAWEPDYDYNNYQWILGRTEGGEWDLLTWGY